MSVSTPTIGATTFKATKPTGTVGSASDATAPFALGMTLDLTPTDGAKLHTLGKFCRVGATSIASNGSAGITSGVTVATASGNTWANETSTILVEGDYVFLAGVPVVV